MLLDVNVIEEYVGYQGSFSFRHSSSYDKLVVLLEALLAKSWLCSNQNPCHMVRAKYLHVLAALLEADDELHRQGEVGTLMEQRMQEMITEMEQPNGVVKVRRA